MNHIHNIIIIIGHEKPVNTIFAANFQTDQIHSKN